MKSLLLIFSMALCLTAKAQTLQWAKNIGGEQINGITLDASENVYTVGTFRDSADFDPGPGKAYSYAGFYSQINVSKLNSSGNLVWAKQFGGAESDYGNDIAVDASGNVFITGTFENTADFNPGSGTFNLTAPGSYKYDVFVVKLDASGNFVWAKQMGGNDHDFCYSISVDASGNVYTIGAFRGTADFDPGASTVNLTTNGQDFFISKLDASGNFVWVKQIEGNARTDGRPNDMSIDALGNIYVTGTFGGTVDFDPGANVSNLTSAGNIDIFICKYNSSGDLTWAKSMGGGNYDVGNSIALDASGNVYTTGYFAGTVDFDPGANTTNLNSLGSSDIFISKLDGSGNFGWIKQIGGSSDEVGISLTIDATGYLYLTGNFMGTVDFDPGTGTNYLTSNGSNDIFICKLDGSGSLSYAANFGDSQSDGGIDIAVSSSKNVYTGGNFNGTIDFDPGTSTSDLSTTTGNYTFVSKLSQLPAVPTSISDAVEVSTLSLYPNPANDKIVLHAVINKAEVTYQLMDLSCKEIIRGNIESEYTEIPLDKLPAGLYLLNIEGEVLKVVKK